jgi:hypothetical protein
VDSRKALTGLYLAGDSASNQCSKRLTWRKSRPPFFNNNNTSSTKRSCVFFPAISAKPSVTYSTCQVEIWAAQAPGVEHQLAMLLIGSQSQTWSNSRPSPVVFSSILLVLFVGWRCVLYCWSFYNLEIRPVIDPACLATSSFDGLPVDASLALECFSWQHQRLCICLREIPLG